MMKSTVLFICLAVIISSCSKVNNQVKMIPKNALVVLHLNTKSLMSKLSWNDIKQTSWFKELTDDTATNSWTKEFMDNPERSGVKFSAGLVVIVQKQPGMEPQLIIEGEISDAAAFESFNKNLDKNGSISKDGDLILVVVKDKSVTGWDGKKFAYVLNAEKFAPQRQYEDAISTMPGGSLPNGSQDLTLLCKKLFALPSDSSMAKVEKFSNLLKDDADVHVWQNNEEIARSSVQMGMIGMMKLDVFLKGNITTSTGKFENGKINFNQRFYTSKELTDLLKKYGGGKVNTDIVKNIPSQNVAGVLSIHFKPEGLKEIITLTGMDGFLNMFLSQKGITIDDFVKANKGDLMLAVTDFVMKKDSVNNGGENAAGTFTYEKPDANVLFSVSIGDKASFDKLMAAGKKLEEDMGGNQMISAANNSQFFVVSNSKETVSKYISGNNNKFDFTSRFSEHPVSLFIDLQKILTTALPQASKDSAGKLIMEESVKTWQNVYAVGGDYKDDAFVMDLEINLVDKNTNSLKQLNSYFDKIAKVIKEKEKKNKEDWSQDSLAIPPVEQIDTLEAKP